jgi:hypothetical protein
MSATLLDLVIEPFTDCLTPDAARKIVGVRADPELQARVDALADKANEGLLSTDERVEYDRYLAWFHVVTMLQARARTVLDPDSTP